MKSIYFKIFSVILIASVGIVVYSNTFHSSFQFDDNYFIVNNSAIKNIHNLQGIWNFLPCRFIFYLSLALNYDFNQLNVFGYHLVNLAIHLVSAVLVWWLILLTLSTPAMKENKIAQYSNIVALLAGLIFVAHPVQTQAVTYIMQRAASLAAMFYLASLCFYVKSRLRQDCVIASEAKVLMPDTRNSSQSFKKIASSPSAPRNDTTVIIFYVCSLIIAILAMFTKEITITLPLMILLYEFCFFKRMGQYKVGPYEIIFLLTLFIIPLTMHMTKSANAISSQEMQRVLEGSADISSTQYLLTEFRVIVTYIRLLFLPLNQNVDYDYPLSQGFFELPTIISFLFLATILYFAVRLFSKYRLIAFSIFWFFLTLLPESSLYPIKDVIFEHRLYLPLAGYSIFLVSGVYYCADLFYRHSEHSEESKGVLRSFASLRMTVALLILIIGINSFLTYQRNKVWRDEFTLWNDTVRKSPHKARPYNNRGAMYSRQDNPAKAILDYSKAIELNPIYADAYNNRASAYAKEGNYTQALSDITKAITLNPQSENVYNNRGVIYNAQDHFAQAISDYSKAIELNPQSEYAYNNRGVVYKREGNFAQAILDYNKAIALNPYWEETYNNRGFVYDQEGDLAHALLDYNKAIELNPKYAEAYYNRATVYNKEGDFVQAVSDFNKAIELDAKYADAHGNRGLIYYKQGNLIQALSDYNTAIELNPKFIEAYAVRGLVYLKQNKFTEALSDFNKAIALKPKYADVYNSRGFVYNRQGDFNDALSDYTKAIQLNPGFGGAYYNRAVTYYELKVYDKAWADTDKAQKLGAAVDLGFINVLKAASGRDS